MFTPNQEQSAAELLRVCRPGGRIGLTNWTPDGFIGQMFKIVGRYVAPPAGIRSPLEWGTEARLTELFGDRAAKLDSCAARSSSSATARPSTGSTRSASSTARRTRRSPRSMRQRRRRLEQDLLTLAREHNTSAPARLRIPSEYLEVVATV